MYSTLAVLEPVFIPVIPVFTPLIPNSSVGIFSQKTEGTKT
jgi:hypothetical protein